MDKMMDQIHLKAFENKRPSFYNVLSKVWTVFFLTFFFISAQAAQNPALEKIFVAQDIYEMTLQAPFGEMAQFKKENGTNFLANKNKKFQATLSYKNSRQQKVSLPIRVSMRGFTSLQACDLPKLEIKFEKSTADTIFEGIQKIDLNTHCGEWQNKQNPELGDKLMYSSLSQPFREVPIYRLMEKMGLPTLKVHPILVNYLDTTTQQRPNSAFKEQYQAFFIEDKSNFMKRMNLSEMKGVHDSFKQIDLADQKTTPEQYQFLSVQTDTAKLDLKQIAQIELLQFLIGNNDWYIKKTDDELRIPDRPDYLNELWNINVFSNSADKWLVLAHDYNLSYIPIVEIANEFSFALPFQNRFLSMLNETEKKQTLYDFIRQKPLFLKELQLLQEDPYYSKIIQHVEEKFLEIEKF